MDTRHPSLSPQHLVKLPVGLRHILHSGLLLHVAIKEVNDLSEFRHLRGGGVVATQDRILRKALIRLSVGRTFLADHTGEY